MTPAWAQYLILIAASGCMPLLVVTMLIWMARSLHGPW